MNMPTIQALEATICTTASSNGSVFQTFPNQDGLRYLDPSSGESLADIALDTFEALQKLPAMMDIGTDPPPSSVIVKVLNAAGAAGGPATKFFTAQQLMYAPNLGAFLDNAFGN